MNRDRGDECTCPQCTADVADAQTWRGRVLDIGDEIDAALIVLDRQCLKSAGVIERIADEIGGRGMTDLSDDLRLEAQMLRRGR